MNKCCHTLFSNVLLHYCILMWIHPHESSLNSTFAYAKHKIYITTLYLGGPILSNHLILPLKLSKIYISQSTILLLYLSYHSILINLKCKTNPLHLFVLLFMFGLYSVFICVQYFLFRLWRGADLQVWLLWVSWLFPRQVTHISPTYFYYCISVF
jgi:hypothetical protein